MTIPSPLDRFLGAGLVWDNHSYMPLRPGDRSFLPQLERLRVAGVHVVSLNVAYADDGALQAEAMLATFHDWIAEHADSLIWVRSPADAERARAEGKLGLCFDLEGMDVLGGELSKVEHFYRLGVRWMLATYNQTNMAAGGCMADDTGLTEYGRAVIAEMNRVGMVVCASHCGYRSAREMIDASASPIIFSHSNARALCDHPRNIPDDLAIACADRGGVIGVNGFGPFLGSGTATTAAFVAHVEHFIDLIGEDHVGIALDYMFDRSELETFSADKPDLFPGDAYPVQAAMVEPEQLQDIAAMLYAHGHGQATLRKLFGGNHLRIAKIVWQ